LAHELPADAPDAGRQAIWSRSYAALAVAVFLTYVNQMTLLPVIPLYVAEIGGTELFAGFALGAFSILSFVLRPRIGRLVDDWNAGAVLLLGCVVLGAFSLGLLLPVLWVILVANALRGIGWAAVNTGSGALLAHLAPASRRGEASGYYAFFQSAGATAGPPLALYWLSGGGSFSMVFAVCAACALAASFACRPLFRASARRRPAMSELSSPRQRQMIARTALLPSTLLVFVMISQPAVLGFVPLFAEEIGVSPSGVTGFYVVSGVAAVLGRSLLGRVADRLGRGTALLGGFTLMAVALVALPSARLVALLLVVAALYSLGQGMALPALTALAIDRADTTQLGVAMATYSAAFQIGLGGGSVISGVLISTLGYGALYYTMALLAVVGSAIALLRWEELRRS
jgi:predicted MFS family arabinose efflux permease